MKRFLVALQFLTILPVKVSSVRSKDFGRSLRYFPLVGLLIGLTLCLIANLTSFLPDIVSAAFIVALSIVLTGGIHLDGLADTCDGFYGSRSKERTLEIMRDSRIGVMGVTGVVIILLFKFTFIASMPSVILTRSLILMAVFGRWSQVFGCYISSYARKEGKAKDFIKYATVRDFLYASIFTVAVFLFVAGLKGIVLLVIPTLITLLFIYYAKKKIGGMTGDTIGALNEIAETAMLFVCIF